MKRTHDISTESEWPVLPAPADSHVIFEQRRTGLDSALTYLQTQNYQDDFNQESVANLLSFINISDASVTDRRLPTAILLTGLDKSNSEAVLQATSERFTRSKSCIFVSLQPRQCLNLQITLKNLIKTAITQHSDTGTYNEFLARNKKFHPLNFDLELLQMFIEEKQVRKIVVSLSDIEDVEVSTVNDLINSLQLWRTQIPSVLLLGITSTRDLFEHRLSRSCLKHLNARTFDFTPSPDQASDLLRRVQTSNAEGNNQRQVFLGPSMVKTLRDLNQGQGNNSQSLKSNMQYLFLSHFVADPASALAVDDVPHSGGDDRKILADIARSTDSFKHFCEAMVTDRAATAGTDLKTILDNDEAALGEIGKGIVEGMNAYASVSKVVFCFSDLYQEVAQIVPKLRQPRLDVELQLYQTMHDLSNCQAFDDLRDGIASLSQRQLRDVLSACDSSVIEGLGLQDMMKAIMSQVDEENSSPSRGHGTQDTPAKTLSSKTPRGKSSKGAKSTAKASKHGGDVSSPSGEELIRVLDRRLQVSSLDISSLLLHEAYILSSRSTHLKQYFDVRPRTAIERALLRPGDYLTCDCCSDQQPLNEEDDSDTGRVNRGSNSGPKESMPSACIMFTLLQEAPTIINVRDLFDAFSSHLNKTVNNTGVPSMEEDNMPDKTMTLFYRALAELKMLGLIKASAGTQVKKRTAGGRASKAATQDVDFIAKTSWAGS